MSSGMAVLMGWDLVCYCSMAGVWGWAQEGEPNSQTATAGNGGGGHQKKGPEQHALPGGFPTADTLWGASDVILCCCSVPMADRSCWQSDTLPSRKLSKGMGQRRSPVRTRSGGVALKGLPAHRGTQEGARLTQFGRDSAALYVHFP